MDRQIGRYRYRYSYRQIDMQIDMRISIHIYRQIDRNTYIQNYTDRQRKLYMYEAHQSKYTEHSDLWLVTGLVFFLKEMCDPSLDMQQRAENICSK